MANQAYNAIARASLAANTASAVLVGPDTQDLKVQIIGHGDIGVQVSSDGTNWTDTDQSFDEIKLPAGWRLRVFNTNMVSARVYAGSYAPRNIDG